MQHPGANTPIFLRNSSLSHVNYQARVQDVASVHSHIGTGTLWAHGQTERGGVAAPALLRGARVRQSRAPLPG